MKHKEKVYPVVTANVALILTIWPCHAKVPADATLVFEDGFSAQKDVWR